MLFIRFDLWAVSFVFTRMSTLTLMFLAVGFGLARVETQGLDWEIGNFNTVLIRWGLSSGVIKWVMSDMLMLSLYTLINRSWQVKVKILKTSAYINSPIYLILKWQFDGSPLTRTEMINYCYNSLPRGQEPAEQWFRTDPHLGITQAPFSKTIALILLPRVLSGWLFCCWYVWPNLGSCGSLSVSSWGAGGSLDMNRLFARRLPQNNPCGRWRETHVSRTTCSPVLIINYKKVH